MIEIPGIDCSIGLHYLGGNKRLYLKLLYDFYCDHHEDILKIRTALAAGEPEQAHRIVHTIKGIAATIGADSLCQIARALDTLFKQGGEEDPTAMIEQLENIMEPIMRELALLSESRYEVRSPRSVDPRILVSLMENLAQRLKEMDPLAEATVNELYRLLEGGPLAEHTHILMKQVANFDFEAAIKSLDELITVMEKNK
ncbi:MAG: Hpt domain-containing protein [Magnetococcales bacterium]|nr:Hpt domain-containing protein [Magnetococcales bacterium]